VIHVSMLSKDCIRRQPYALVGDIVDKDAAISPAVEGPSQTPELLLARSVPDLILAKSTSRRRWLYKIAGIFDRRSCMVRWVRVEEGGLADAV